MFCRNCGKEMLDDAKFCSSCGTSTENKPKTENKPTWTGNGFNLDKATILHYLSIILSAIILLLTFSKWISVDIVGFNSDFSTLDMIEITEKLSGYLSDGLSSILVIFLIILMITVISLCVYYIVKALQDGIYAVYYGYSTMSSIAVFCGIFTIFTLLIFSFAEDFDSISIRFNENMYYIIILACVNRYAVLPTLGKEILNSSEKHILNDDEWLCTNCNHKNNIQHSICKNCGKLR